jgi:NAD(P)-dependent dehydrogenase (short-subunit alcohol dehydrogenase family)
MDMNYAKTAVITGAGSGIGRALSIALAKEAWKIGILDIDLAGAEETQAMVEAAGGEGLVFQADVGELEEMEAAARYYFEEWGEVGMLVNNAGIGAGGYFGEINLKDWEAVVKTDYWGVIYGCQAFIPRMKSQAGGHIVNISSIAGLMPVMGFSPYNTCKAAVVSLSETLVVELASSNIGVTVVCPSVLHTNILEHSLEIIDIEGMEGAEQAMYMIETAMLRTGLTTGEFARRVLRDVGKGRLYSLPKLSTRLLWFGIRTWPSLHYRIWASLSKHGQAQRVMMAIARWGLI